jgi:hypothetical protein
VKPALGIKRLGRRLGITVVGRKDGRTTQEDLAVVGQLEFNDVDCGPTVPKRKWFQRLTKAATVDSVSP